VDTDTKDAATAAARVLRAKATYTQPSSHGGGPREGASAFCYHASREVSGAHPSRPGPPPLGHLLQLRDYRLRAWFSGSVPVHNRDRARSFFSPSVLEGNSRRSISSILHREPPAYGRRTPDNPAIPKEKASPRSGPGSLPRAPAFCHTEQRSHRRRGVQRCRRARRRTGNRALK
jgi:hypothetical protein